MRSRCGSYTKPCKSDSRFNHALRRSGSATLSKQYVQVLLVAVLSLFENSCTQWLCSCRPEAKAFGSQMSRFRSGTGTAVPGPGSYYAPSTLLDSSHSVGRKGYGSLTSNADRWHGDLPNYTGPGPGVYCLALSCQCHSGAVLACIHRLVKWFKGRKVSADCWHVLTLHKHWAVGFICQHENLSTVIHMFAAAPHTCCRAPSGSCTRMCDHANHAGSRSRQGPATHTTTAKPSLPMHRHCTLGCMCAGEYTTPAASSSGSPAVQAHKQACTGLAQATAIQHSKLQQLRSAAKGQAQPGPGTYSCMHSHYSGSRTDWSDAPKHGQTSAFRAPPRKAASSGAADGPEPGSYYKEHVRPACQSCGAQVAQANASCTTILSAPSTRHKQGSFLSWLAVHSLSTQADNVVGCQTEVPVIQQSSTEAGLTSGTNVLQDWSAKDAKQSYFQKHCGHSSAHSAPPPPPELVYTDANNAAPRDSSPGPGAYNLQDLHSLKHRIASRLERQSAAFRSPSSAPKATAKSALGPGSHNAQLPRASAARSVAAPFRSATARAGVVPDKVLRQAPPGPAYYSPEVPGTKASFHLNARQRYL